MWVGERRLLAVAAPLPHESACGSGDFVTVLSVNWEACGPEGQAAWASVEGAPT